MAVDAPTLERWRTENSDHWTPAEMAEVWRRWHPYLAAGLFRPVTELIVQEAGIAPGMRVLDLAGGSGEPALTLAGLVGPTGHVTGTDFSPSMVAVAAEQARAAGITNADFEPADAEALPYPDASFDAVTCRFGVMFFPDTSRALGEIRRVLRPGVRATFTAWGPSDRNLFFAGFAGVLATFADLPSPEIGAPGAFRFAKPGALGGALREEGFADVREETRDLTLTWPGPAETLRAFWLEMTDTLDKVPAERREEASAAVLAAFRQYEVDGRVELPAVVVVASGQAGE
ncbi:MAG: class I SAM-dependent methyltransferase [Chloroflexota bacterium]|nr:class I SAM-dependent methyltransferase [Chloroflexota bacterium]